MAETHAPSEDEVESGLRRLDVANDSEDTELIRSLYNFGHRNSGEGLSGKQRRDKRNLLRSTVHHVHDPQTGQTHNVTSWKMADYEYKKDPCPFPTRARGLFTEELPDDQYRIVARGYNKFFNVGEVSWTKWEALPETTRGPYYLTLKSNGCIILIAALSNHSLLVTSKHSIGALAGKDQSHAERGEAWLEKHLSRVGKTKEHLAEHLWRRKLTAVAELCDDEFEEHVLGYDEATTGLHLHGLNRNSGHLLTYPPNEVEDFARHWGLHPTPFETLQSVAEVKRFTDECAKTGKWRGQWAEGFVVRASSAEKAASDDEDRLRAFMWKVKFDEPYLTWREWRELTKRMLTNRKKEGPASTTGTLSKGQKRPGHGKKGTGHELYGVKVDRLRREETKLYVQWCASAIDEHPDLFEEYHLGRGIIAARDRFLAWLNSEEGQQEKRRQRGSDPKRSHSAQRLANGRSKPEAVEYHKTLIVPIAIPGCGKTMMSLALAELFGWGHTQSDDVKYKKSAPHFLASVKSLLESPEQSIVIADKNNHLQQHRRDLAHVVQQLAPSINVRMIAIIWDLDRRPVDETRRICLERITQRGEHHQTLRPSDSSVDEVLAFFLSQRQPFDPAQDSQGDGCFDAEVIVSLDREPRIMLDEIMDGLVANGVINDDLPNDEDRQEALLHASSYQPALRKEASTNTSPRKSLGSKASPSVARNGNGTPRYYGISLDTSLLRLLPPDLPLPGSPTRFPHVTIVHKQELPRCQTTWDSAKEQAKTNVSVILGPKFALVRDYVAALAARYEPANLIEGADGQEMHVTVATGPGVSAVASKYLFQAIRAGHTDYEGHQIEVIDVGELQVQGVLEGLVS